MASLPPRESRLCLNPSVVDHPKKLAKHYRSGQPLLNQQPDTTRAHQRALFNWIQDLGRLQDLGRQIFGEL